MNEANSRKLRWTSAVGLVVAASLFASTAQAACSDKPAPNVDWRRCYQDNRDFGAVDLSGANLRDAYLARSDFTGANFSTIDGRRAKFVTASLSHARFDGARLIGADFTKSDLTETSFRGSDLRRARFFRAVLRGADFTDARLDGTDFLKADLSGATWTDGKTVCAEGSIGQCN